MIILNIIVPTFNRKNYLTDLLNSIESNTNSVNKNIFQVVIIDNCSTDGTSEIRNNYSFNINYIKNETNIGGNNNIHKSYNTSNSLYTWVIGDDELLPENSINTILQLILKDSPSLIINRIKNHPTLTDLPQHLTNYKVFGQIADYKNPYLLLYHSYISANIIKTECYQSSIHDKHINNLYSWFHALISGVIDDDHKISIPELPTLIVREQRAAALDIDLLKFHHQTLAAQIEYLWWIKLKLNLAFEPEFVVHNYELACGKLGR